jgi:hypothetical protein
MGQTLILHIQKGSLSFKKKTPLWEGVKGGRGGSLSTPNLFGGGVLLPNPSIFKSPSLFERFLPSQNHLGGGTSGSVL